MGCDAHGYQTFVVSVPIHSAVFFIFTWHLIFCSIEIINHPNLTRTVTTMKQLEAPPTADELREIRLTYNLTPKELGEVLNVGPQTVRSYESGKTPFPWKHLKRINRLLSRPVPPTPPCPPCPDELRLLRTSRGLTQKQVAEAFGLTYSSISNYERGLTPIPDGLPECIMELADPKDYLLQP